MVKSVNILAPDGAVFQKIKNSSYNPTSYFGDSGYETLTINDYARFTFYNSSYHAKKMPRPGKYYIEITSKTGHITKTPIIFRGGSDPIIGYPENINFNPNTRQITWEPTQGQTGYRVLLFEGDKGDDSTPLNMTKLVFLSTGKITETSFALPQSIDLKKGQDYFITVASHNSDDHSLERQDFVHMQYKLDEIASFTIN